MKADVLLRLKEAVAADPRSLRQLSLDAGLGENYVQQMLRDGKDPTVDKLEALLETLGKGDMFYVLTGLRVRPQDLSFLQLVLSAPESLRGAILQILSAVEAGQS